MICNCIQPLMGRSLGRHHFKSSPSPEVLPRRTPGFLLDNPGDGLCHPRPLPKAAAFSSRGKEGRLPRQLSNECPFWGRTPVGLPPEVVDYDSPAVGLRLGSPSSPQRSAQCVRHAPSEPRHGPHSAAPLTRGQRS